MSTTNVIQNIINIGNQSGCGQTPTCPGYSIYIPCIQNINRGTDTTINFYLLDSQGHTINTKDLIGFTIALTNQFNCEEAIGIYGGLYIESDSDSLPTFDIKSHQENYEAPIIKDDFSNLMRDEKEFQSNKYEYIDNCYNDNGCVRLGYKHNKEDIGSTGILKLKTEQLPYDFTVKIVAKNGTKNQSNCCVTVNGKMYIKELSDVFDTDDMDNNFETLDFSFGGIDGDVNIDIQSIKKDKNYHYAEMKLKSFEIITTDCISDEGHFSIDLPSEFTSELVRGDLKIRASIVDKDNKLHITSCAIAAKVK